MKKSVIAAAALAALGACMAAPEASNYYGVTAPIPTSQAMGYFQQICVQNHNNLERARQTMAGLPVVRNTNDDIYYHTQYLISFKITPVSRRESVCSMVWDPIESNGASMASMGSLDPSAVLRDNGDGTITAFHYGNP